jgi:ankyrin repeat protein
MLIFVQSKYLIEVAHQNQNLALSRELEGCETFQHQYASPSPSTESNVGISDTYAQPYTPYYLNHKSPRLCIQTVGILVGLLGWVSIETTSQYTDCTDHSSKSTKRASSYLCLIYHSPWWIGTLACILRLQGTPSPCISLSFRTLLPPDAEVFVCIRTGQVERLKILFIERRACVADMMGPYGLSTIAIAILYGQTEICQFLHSAVGNRMSHTLLKSKVTGSEVGKFWSTYSSLDCSVPAAAVIHDHFYDTSPELAAKVLSSLASQSCPERDSFTRLHQCVLKLTAESLETLLADPRLDINETDSLGRTALHMATYLCDIQAIDLLIRHNANHEIEEYAGKSPLRVAATVGWAEGTSLLANISTDLEQRGDFGCTILHDVCFQGHAHIVKLLLDAGANMEAMNDLLETPLRHAVVGNQVEVLKVLHERGAAFTMCDNIGCTAFHDAILVNSHPCLEFLLGLHVRVDQKYLTQGQTALHLLAENADFCTLEIFLNNAHTGLAGLDVAARDGKDFTALEYLNFRKDEEFKNTFHLLLKQVDVARQEKQHSLLKESIIQLKGNGSFVDEDENDDFADALENQAEY